jgi:hypothetical protein
MKTQAQRQTVVRLSLMCILLLAIGLGVCRLGYQELSGDEAFGYFFSLQSYPDMVRSTLTLGEPHPVASYYVQKAWLAAVGYSEFALRFTSVWWSVLAVALLYVLARRLGLGEGASLLSAALLAVSPYAVWHGQNARMYAMSLALTLASSWLAIEAILRKRWILWVAYVLVSWLCLQTHYYTVFVILVQNVLVVGWTLLVKRTPRRLVPWVMSQLALGLLILPWLLSARNTLASYGGNADSPPLGSLLVRSLSVFAVGEMLPRLPRTLSGYLAGFLVLVALARLVLSGPVGRRTAASAAAYLGIPLLAIWLGAQSRPIFNERYILDGAPAFYLLASVAVLGVGTTGLRSRVSEPRRLASGGQAPAVKVLEGIGALTGTILLVAALISLGNYFTDPAYSKTRGWRELATTMTRLSSGIPTAGVRLAQNFPDPSLWYYYRGPVAHLVLPPAASDAAGADREAANLVKAGVQRVILAAQPAEWWDRDGIAEAALAKYYAPVAAIPLGGWSTRVYATPPAAVSPIGVSFANGVTLAAAVPESRQLIPGGVLVVHLRWRDPQDRLTGTEKITLQILDSQGALVAQNDLPLGASEIGAPVTSYAILIPPTLSPGRYRLIVALYDPERPDSGRLLTTTGADHVDLSELYVE